MSRRVPLLVAVAGALLRCGGEPEPPPRSSPAPAVERAPRVLHGDHYPRHDGVVWMQSDDLHFEVVLEESGAYRVYFSDAVRTELPAAVASDVTVAVRREQGGPEETVTLAIDEYGESWIGRGEPVEDAPDAAAIVRFVYEGEPYQLEFPFHTEPMQPGAPDPHVTPPEP